MVKAVDGVSFTLDRGKTLGIVGESGSGKTILSRSIMGLLPSRNVVREGSVEFEGQRSATSRPPTMREIWGTEMAMIFQDPMTSLNPVMKIGAPDHRVAASTTSTCRSTTRRRRRCRC